MSIKLIKKAAGSLLVAVFAMSAMAVLPAGSLPGSLGTQNAAACTKYWRVAWSVAGIYDAPNANVLATLGQRASITGPQATYSSTWTYVYHDWVAYTQMGPQMQHLAFMRRDALDYVGCG